MSIAITPEIADVLSRSTTSGNLLTLPSGQLDRKLYEAVNKVLVALGGKWNRKIGGHVFDGEAATRVENALGNGKAVSRQKTLQFFETPSDLAQDLVARLDVRPDDSCLEPSAGRGRIVNALSLAGATNITVIEIDGDNTAALEKQGLATRYMQGDFLSVADIVAYDVIAMNPPFRGNQDIRHVRHAYGQLARGGRLGAIVSTHAWHGREREAVEWRSWLASLDHCEVIPVPENTFKESGTAVATMMVIIRKSA